METLEEKRAHDNYYAEKTNGLEDISTIDKYVERFEKQYLSPFYLSGNTKGCVRGLATSALLDVASGREYAGRSVTILDAGCGQGELSVYLACKGFNVIGVDLSLVACDNARALAQRIGVSDKCDFMDADLGKLPVDDEVVDFIIGHASLHHFIKYQAIPAEFSRVLKSGGKGFFADSFGENKIYSLFHDKKKMERLGDVSLTLSMINDYFGNYFEVELTPADWFSMLDKLYMKVFPKSARGYARNVSRVHYALDRVVPVRSRVALFLSGSVMTSIHKK